jgi:small-conductance mechanosensitive channel
MRELRYGIGKDGGMINTVIDNANAVLFVLTAVILTILAIRITSTVLMHTMRAYSESQNATLHRALAPLMNRLVMFVIAALAIIVVLDHFGQNVNSLLTLLGAGSLAIGLAAQDTISNMISGFVIMIDRPFHIGDRIRIPSGEEGDVYEIGMRSTTILDFDNNLIVVPNNDLIRTKIVNYSYPTPEHRVTVDVNAAYGTGVDVMKDLMMSAARANTEVMPVPPPEVFLVNLADSSMQYRLVCRVDSFNKKFAVAEQLRIAVYNKMREVNIEIPYPRYVVQLKDVQHAL